MGKMEISFPFTVCQHIVENADRQLCHVYKASISVQGADGTKTNGSLRTRVFSSKVEKMVEFEIALPQMPVKCNSDMFRCRIEDVQKIVEVNTETPLLNSQTVCECETVESESQTEGCASSTDLCETTTESSATEHCEAQTEGSEAAHCRNRIDDNNHSHGDTDRIRSCGSSKQTDHSDRFDDIDTEATNLPYLTIPAQNKEVIESQTLSTKSSIAGEKETAENKDDTLEDAGKKQDTSGISSSDHGYSLVPQESKDGSQVSDMNTFPQNAPTSEKRGVKKYDELIRKLKETTDAQKTEMASSKSVSTVSSTNNLSASSSSHSPTVLDHAVSKSRQEKSEAETHISDSLSQTASKSSGHKEIPTEISKEESATDEEEIPYSGKRFVRKYDRLIKNLELASKRSGLEMLSVISGYKSKVGRDTKSDHMGVNKVSTVTIATKDSLSCNSSVKQSQKTDDPNSCVTGKSKFAVGIDREKSIIKSQIISNEKKPINTASSNLAVKSRNILKSQPGAPQGSVHLMSFPRKFPSSLTRTDAFDALTRKRQLTCGEMLAGTPKTKHRKESDCGKVNSATTSESRRNSMGEKAETSVTLPDDSQKTSGQKNSSGLVPAVTSDCVVAAGCGTQSLSGKPAVPAAASPIMQVTQTPPQIGLSSRFFLPMATPVIQQMYQPQNNVLMGPFQLLGKSPGIPQTLLPMSANPKPWLFIPGPLTTASSSSSSSSGSKGKKVVTGEPPKIDHDYTDLVYDKNAPSSRALKTLVKPISLSQHINARVEKVEEGQGSSLVTISGLNRKAAGGPHLCCPPLALRVTKEGMPIAETLKDVLTDAIRCREKVQESYQQAVKVNPTMDVRMDTSGVPVAKEIVVTPSGYQQILLHCKRRRTFSPQPQKKAAAINHRQSLPETVSTDGVTQRLEGADTDPVFQRNEAEAVTGKPELDNLSLGCWDEGASNIHFQPGDQTTMELPNFSSEQGCVIDTNSAVKVDTAVNSKRETTKQDAVVIHKEETTEEDVVIENEKEAVTTGPPVSARFCRYCLKIFHTSIMIYKHVKNVHAAYSACAHYRYYLRTLKKDSQVLCPMCPHKCLLSNEYHLRAHLASSHGKQHVDLVDYSPCSIPPSLCEVCQMHFHSVSELKAHAMLLHNCDLVSCPHCPLVFIKEDTRAKHMSLVHGDNSACPYLCSLCSESFENKEDLRLHKQVHGSGPRLPGSEGRPGIRGSKSRPPKPKWRNVTKGSIRCPHCPAMEFSSVAQLRRHRHRVHSGAVPIHCPMCGVSYKQVGAMHGHLKTHLPRCLTKGRPSRQCPFCDQTVPFRRAYMLVLHLLKKHQDCFPHRCSFCSQGFASEKPLQTHVRQAHHSHSVSESLSASGSSAVVGGDSRRLAVGRHPPSSTVASTDEVAVETGQTEPGFCGLPAGFQKRILAITQQGKQAVVTVNTEKRGIQKIIFTPSQPHTVSSVLGPTSQTGRSLGTPDEGSGVESSQAIAEGEGAFKEEFPEHFVVDMDVCGDSGGCLAVEDTIYTDGQVTAGEVSMVTEVVDTGSDHARHVDGTPIESMMVLHHSDGISPGAGFAQRTGVRGNNSGESVSVQNACVKEGVVEEWEKDGDGMTEKESVINGC